MVIDFNDGWNCRYAACGEWREVTLPHDAMMMFSTRDESVGEPNIGWFSGGDCVYKKTFAAPCGERKVFLFEGVFRDAEVYINGSKVASNDCGYRRFYVDATDCIAHGDNEIVVVAHNSDQPNSRWYTGTGIYRPVRLFALPKNHIAPDGIKVRTVSAYPARIEVRVDVCGEGVIEATVERNGKIAASAAAVFESGGSNRAVFFMDIPNAELWSDKTPDLYGLRVKFGEDERSVKFGIRKLQCDSTVGFTVNGERVILRGACVHHDNGIIGACGFREAEYRKAYLLKKAGYNAVRSAHNPCSEYFLEACDELGLYVLDEYSDMWYIHKTKYDYADRTEINYERDIADMIAKDYNHPSVVMYSLGNEVAETSEKRGIDFLRAMVKTVKELDDRPVTAGINPFFNFLYAHGFGQYSDKKAKRGSRKKSGSAFFNALAGKLGAGFMKTMARLGGCDKYTSEAYAALDVAGYNYGIKRYKHDIKKYPDRVILGSETFCSDAYGFFELAKTTNAIIGDFVWAGIDYLGEIGVGAWERREYAPVRPPAFGWISAGSGRLDLIGDENGEALYTRVAFETDNGPSIAVSPVTGDRRHTPSAWKFSDALPSWSYSRVGAKTRVEVYSRAPCVELFINGKSHGVKKFGKNCRFDFNVRYEHGVITAVERDENGREMARSELRSADINEVCLYAQAERKHTDDDIYFIHVYYGDARGVWKPCVDGTLEIEIVGGEVLAFGNACPYNVRGYTEGKTDTYYGRALAVVRARGQAVVTIKDGEHTARVEIGEK